MNEKYGMSKLTKLNIKWFLDREFINKGLYTNIGSDDIDINGNYIGTLKRVDANTYESLFDKWIYETDASGIAPNNTIIASGVYINDILHVRNSGYSPIFDYNKGRVLFSGSGLPNTAEVKVNFAYKFITVEFPDAQIVQDIFNLGKSNAIHIQNSYPSGNHRQVPLVIIDLQKRLGNPFALGGSKQYDQTIYFHILTETDDDMDTIIDILSDKLLRNVIQGVNFNKTPAILTYQGDIDTSYQNFTDLQNNTSYQWAKLYIDYASVISRDYFGGYRRGRVEWRLKLMNIT